MEACRGKADKCREESKRVEARVEMVDLVEEVEGREVVANLQAVLVAVVNMEVSKEEVGGMEEARK